MKRTEINGVMFQYFEWNSPSDGKLWNELTANAPKLKELGISSVWLPPAYKSMGGKQDVGYAVYDIWDLGEFNQKGSTRTKYGTKDEFIAAVKAVQSHGIQVYLDIVLNHRLGGDELEDVEVSEIGEHGDKEKGTYAAKVWSRFTFPGRAGKHSSFTYSKNHFTAFGAIEGQEPDDEKIYLLASKTLSPEPAYKDKNNDFLLGADVDLYNDEVRADLFAWGKWLLEITGIDGFRLDAVKHMAASFYKDWLGELRKTFKPKELFTVGEYSTPDVEELINYEGLKAGVMSMLDIPLQTRLHDVSTKGKDFDLSTIFDGSLVQVDPVHAVTFVESHDTQLGKSEAYVQDWFKPQAYALILLRDAGYPIIFYGDYFGSTHEANPLTSFKDILTTLVAVRKDYLHGDCHDYFDAPGCIGWVWSGDTKHPGAVAVVLSNGDVTTKHMKTFQGSRVFKDATGAIPDTIATDENGEADFACLPGGLSVWITEK